MKRLMMVLIATMVMYAGYSQSERKGPKPGSDKERMERAKADLGLSAEQFQQWKDIHKKYAAEIKAARDARDRKKGQELRTKINGELEAILDESQKKKFAEMKKRRPRGKGGK